MIASEFVKLGNKIIGVTVVTPAVGDYPGGPAMITELYPDPGALEVVFMVDNPLWPDTIGILTLEDITQIITD